MSFIVTPPFFISRKKRVAVTVMKSVNRSTFVSVQPSAIGAKGNEISERYFGIVPHDEDEDLRMLKRLVVAVGYHGKPTQSTPATLRP